MDTGNPDRPGRLARIAVLLALVALNLLVATAVQAGMDPVKTGEIPELDSDEGLLVVAVDTTTPIAGVYMRKDGSVMKASVLKKIEAGRSSRLMRLPAGRYGWHSVSTDFGSRFELADDPEFYFDVRPGTITYGGDLVYRPYSLFRATIHSVNHALAALDWLESEHPQLYAHYSFTYSGHYPDPFPAFYKKFRGEPGSVAKAPSAWPAPPVPDRLPLSPKVLWQQDHVGLVALNPGGDLLAIQTRLEGKEAWAVDLIDLVAGESQRVARSDVAFEGIEWSGSNTLLLSLKANDLAFNALNGQDPDQIVTVVHVIRDEKGTLGWQGSSIPRRGRILDVLAEDPDHVLFATLGLGGDLHVYKIDISTLKAIRKFNPEKQKALNRDGRGEFWWFADGVGNLRVAFSRMEGDLVMSIPEDSKLVEILRLKGDSDLTPVSLSYDGNTIFALSDKDREQRDLVEFDIATKRITRTVYSKPGVDIVSAILDSRRAPIGVRYHESGRLVNDYFQNHDRHLAVMMRKAFPGLSVSVIDRSTDSRQLILWVEGGDTPPKIYHLDTGLHKAALLEDTMPWLAATPLAPSHLVKATSKDGLQIEAFLTLPQGKDKRPLIVLPHGGPIGVSDTLRFDRDTQFLASLGYAVLRVNYRGSDGFGKTFREAGYGKFGTAIEDDIDAALNVALADFPLDSRRMCMLGFSYGGYSALIAAARWPDRFRCVASVSGVSDRILFYTASDGGRTAQGRANLEKVLGDPKTQQAEMIGTSPLYRVREIKVPVMLAHGLEDQRVDYEHSRRMKRMLDMVGRPPVGFAFPGEGHGIENLDNLDKLWTGIAGFLEQNLRADGVPKPDASAAAH